MKLPNSHLSTEADDSELRPSTFRNPFVYELKFSTMEKIKIAVMSVTVFPVRLLMTAFFMLLAWPFAFTAALGRSQFTVEEQCLWRRFLDLSLRVIMRAMWFCGGFHWITVKGERAPPSQAPILTLAPHSSYFDAIPVTMTMGSIVAKAESRSIPVWGTLINFIRPVFVSRSDPESRRKTVEEIRRRAHTGGEWPQIMIFPEGTCTNRSCLIRYKPGAFIPAVPVQPVVLRYPNKLDTITWTWQGPGAFKVLWLTLCQIHNPIEIEYLPIYIPSEEEKSDPALFANNVRRIMAKALQVPLTDLSFDDCQLSLSQGPLRIPSNSSLLEFNRLVRRLGLRAGTTDMALEHQASRARKLWRERLGLEDFAQYLNLPVSDMLTELHALLDQHGEGQVDVRQYVVSLSVVCRPARSLETLRLAFQMFAAEDDGPIVEEELAAILRAALGLAHVDVSRLFAAVDTDNKGKITYDEFQRFAEQQPDFSQRYLHPHNPPQSNGFTRPRGRKDD